MAGTVASEFDRRANGLNFLRLCLAAGVIVWHSVPLTGHAITWPPLRQLMGDISVDTFFAISGFLIAGSWLGRPRLGSFLLARALRILPAFYACLLFTALVLAPVMVAITGGRLHLADEWAYIRANGLMWVNRYEIAGTPEGVPYPHVWNGSIWTLAWESLCYLGIAALGLAGLLRRRRVSIAAFCLVWLLALGVALGFTDRWLIVTFARFALVFFAGVIVQLWADRIPVNRWLITSCAIAIPLSAFLPNYRLVAALPLAYLAIVLGSRLRAPRWQLHNDLSYGVYVYAFPVQQSLAMLGLWRLGPIFPILSMIFTLPFAAASWFGVERWALKLKSRRPRPAIEPNNKVTVDA